MGTPVRDGSGPVAGSWVRPVLTPTATRATWHNLPQAEISCKLRGLSGVFPYDIIVKCPWSIFNMKTTVYLIFHTRFHTQILHRTGTMHRASSQVAYARVCSIRCTIKYKSLVPIVSDTCLLPVWTRFVDPQSLGLSCVKKWSNTSWIRCLFCLLGRWGHVTTLLGNLLTPLCLTKPSSCLHKKRRSGVARPWISPLEIRAYPQKTDVADTSLTIPC